MSKQLWQCFAVANKACEEATALLNEIQNRLINLELDGVNIRSDGVVSKIEKNGWTKISETRNFPIRRGKKRIPAQLLAIQIVFFSGEADHKAGNQSIINVIYESWYAKDPYYDFNYFESDDWDDMRLAHDGKLIYYEEDGGEVNYSDCIFSLPIHAIESPDDIEEKIITPIRALLSNNESIEMPQDALTFKGSGEDITFDK